MIRSYNNYIIIPQLAMITTNNSIAGQTGMILDATTEKLALKYYPSTTSPITNIDVRLGITGAPGTFRMGVFADSNNAPNDASQLGGYTANFAAPGASGWTGLKALTVDTGNLTINTPVWVVIEYVSGTLDASNYIQLQQCGSANIITNRPLSRHYNGTNWTTTSSVTAIALSVIKHSNGSYGHYGLVASIARSSANDIYVNAGTTQVQGVRFKCGAQVKVQGVLYYINKAGTPNDLTWSIYEGNTFKYSETEVVGNVQHQIPSICWFSSPVLLAADTNLYIIASQTGTSDANDYDCMVWAYDATYLETIAVSDLRFVYGNGTTPSALSVSTTDISWCFPIISDPALDLDMVAGGSGGMLVHPGMSGGLNG